jgi:hypothetical protein
MIEITHNNLPEAVSQIRTELSEIKQILLGKSNEYTPETDCWFDLDTLVKYDPEKRSKATFYGYTHQRSIPFHKRGKKIIFLKSEIDDWIKSGRRKTLQEISAEAGNYIFKKKPLKKS